MSVKLVEVIKSGVVESTHMGSIAVVSWDGRLLESLGCVDRLTYFHSSAKPIQGIASLETGIVEKYGLDLKETALIISSHSGENEHIEVLRGLMQKTGASEDIMECGIADPVGKGVLKQLLAAGKPVTKLHCNCSGKHLGFIAACKARGLPVEGYHRPDHPMQEYIRSVLSDFCGIPPGDLSVGVDGCTVPVYAVPLRNMAYAYANLCNREFMGGKYAKSQNYILSAMTMFPEYVGGDKRFDTLLMRRFGERVIGKVGAEGVYCAGILDKNTGIALKIEDGAIRAVAPAVVEILLQLGVIDQSEAQELGEFYKTPVLNNKGEEIGIVRPVFKLA